MVYLMENPIKMDDLGVPLFLETPIYYLHLHIGGFHIFVYQVAEVTL